MDRDRLEEIFQLAMETHADPEAFEAGLRDIAKRDVAHYLDALGEVAIDDYPTIIEFARTLYDAAIVARGHGGSH